MKQQEHPGHELKREKISFFSRRSAHVPSYGRKQNLRLCPPFSLGLSFKLASRILSFLNYYCYYYFPPFHCCKKSCLFVLEGSQVTPRTGEES